MNLILISMIYITHKYSDISESHVINNVWEVSDDVEKLYKEFMLSKATEIDLIINPYWYNEMNHKDNNTHLSSEEYKEKVKQWKKIRRQWNIDKYINDVLRGCKLEFKELYR